MEEIAQPSQFFLLTFWHSVAIVALYYVVRALVRRNLRPKIFIVEDSDVELALYSHFIGDLDGRARVTCYKSLSEFSAWSFFRPPCAVVVDQNLQGTHLGEALVEYCLKHRIDASLVTGDEGGCRVPKDRIIRKRADLGHYAVVREWLLDSVKKHQYR
jgi:hypothetical protein